MSENQIDLTAYMHSILTDMAKLQAKIVTLQELFYSTIAERDALKTKGVSDGLGNS